MWASLIRDHGKSQNSNRDKKKWPPFRQMGFAKKKSCIRLGTTSVTRPPDHPITMPMYKCKSSGQYQVMMLTGGPRPEDIDQQKTKEELAALTKAQFGTKLRNVLVAMEVSANGYRHYHIGVALNKASRFKMWNAQILSYIKDHPDPSATQKSNSGCWHFSHKENAPYEALKKYVHNPSKDKELDDDVLEYELPQFKEAWQARMHELLHSDRSGWTTPPVYYMYGPHLPKRSQRFPFPDI